MSSQNTAPGQGPGNHSEPVLVFKASTSEEAEIVKATLVAVGIRAYLKSPTDNPILGEVDEVLGDLWQNGIYVAAEDREEAEAVLNAPPLSDEDLTQVVEADKTTLEEAEKKAKRE